MSTTPKLTLWTLYQFTDGDIFEDLTLPDEIDKDGFVNRLLMTRGEHSVLWPDPDFFKRCVTIWGQNWYDNFARIAATLAAEYNPIHNYDRHEEYTDTEGVGKSGTSTASGRTDSETEQQVSAFDESTYQPDSKTILGSGSSSTDSSSERIDRELTHDAHLYGNIGVTTSQEMLQAEVKLRSDLRLYDIMCDVFSQELLLLTY